MDNIKYPDLSKPLPLLSLRNVVVFPNNVVSIDASRLTSVNSINEAKNNYSNYIIVTTQKQSEIDDPQPDQLYDYGCLCQITSVTYLKTYLRIRILPLDVVKISNIVIEDYYSCLAEITYPEISNSKEEMVVFKKIMEKISHYPSLLANLPNNANEFLNSENDFLSFCYTLSYYFPFSNEEKINVLSNPTLIGKLHLILKYLDNQIQLAELDNHLDNEIRKTSEKFSKDYVAREKIRILKEELGEDDDMSKILKQVQEGSFPQNIKDKVTSEIKKFQMNPQGSAENGVIRTYLDTILSIPWSEKSQDNDDLNNVRKVLDEDHYGLDKAKKRIIEYLAVKKMTGNLKAPIICLYGPPGCGKTSLAMSIARALNRKFVKASLGGCHDESEIRGHRRTYVASMPGRIIKGMIKAKVVNPVFLLDEIDKVGGDELHGDVSSALLEVMDPEQNTYFSDNYVEEPYDLSNVLFIATANNIEKIPSPLLDRLELIEVPSYTELEKIQIAKDYLVPKELVANGLKKNAIAFDDKAISYLIMHYTREAGVRELERQISSIIRKCIVEFVDEGKTSKKHITSVSVKKYLGMEIFDLSTKDKLPQVGIITGLAYTDFGGDILSIEVTSFKGKGNLILTGNLGDVMKESCSIALDYVRTNASKYGIDPNKFIDSDVHIHVPEGAVPKDGPSAGIAITVAIISCFSGAKISPDIAITGEVTLRGNALPIGGLREKSLAALRSGIKTIIVPKENKKNVDELPKEVKDNLQIIFMSNVDDAIKAAFIKEND